MSTKYQKAQQIFDEELVQQVNAETYVCHGSNGNQYEIKLNKDSKYNYKYYCKCPAWRFDNTRECKHVLAVELWNKANTGNTKTRKQKVANTQTNSKQYKKQEGEKTIMFSGKKIRFDKNGKLIPQYTKVVQPKEDEEYD